MSNYKNRKSIRLKNWDYRNSGIYFITICTKKMEHHFGEVKNGKMELSPIGAIAYIFWHQIKIFNKNVELGEFIVMPNHIHGILFLDNDDTVGALHCNARTKQCNARTSNENQKNEYMSNISPKANSISTIIRSYKSAVTKNARRLGFDFEWHRNYYEHIVRDYNSYDKISNYIINNPLKWEEDKYYDIP